MKVLGLLAVCRRCRWAYAVHAGLCHYCGGAHVSNR